MSDGYAIVRRLLDEGALARLAGELGPHLDAMESGDSDAFTGHKTKRFGALLWRCPPRARWLPIRWLSRPPSV